MTTETAFVLAKDAAMFKLVKALEQSQIFKIYLSLVRSVIICSR
jgi:hypothetical protein